jgi:hypothetical protein
MFLQRNLTKESENQNFLGDLQYKLLMVKNMIFEDFRRCLAAAAKKLLVVSNIDLERSFAHGPMD